MLQHWLEWLHRRIHDAGFAAVVARRANRVNTPDSEGQAVPYRIEAKAQLEKQFE